MEVLSIDFETAYDSRHYTLKKLTMLEYIKDPRFKVFGFSYTWGTDSDPQWISGKDAADWLAKVDWKNTAVLAQNTAFDAAILAYHYGHVAGHYYDTMGMARALLDGSASLRSVAEALFPNDPLLRKGEMKTDGLTELTPEQEQELATYCNQDVRLTNKIFNALRPYMAEKEFDVIDLHIRMFVDPALLLDEPLVKDYVAHLEARLEETIKQSGLSRSLLASNQKFQAWLEENGYPVPTKLRPATKHEKENGIKGPIEVPALGKNDEAFLALLNYPVLEPVIRARLEVKSRLNETRAKRLLKINDLIKKIPVPLRYHGAHTGRSSGMERINMQNLPSRGEDKTLRKALIAPPGHKIIAVDSGQIEARVCMYLAKQKDIVEAFANNEPLYEKTAEKIFGYPVNKEDHPTERQVGKAAALGLQYGMGAKKFRLFAKATAGVEFTETEAQDIVNKWRNANHRVKWFWNFCDDQLIRMATDPNHCHEYNGLVFTHERIILPSGRYLYYPGLRFDVEEESFRYGQGKYTWGGTIVENIVQAVARDIVFYQALQVQSLGYKIVNLVHDEIVMVVPDEQVDECLERSLEIMRQSPDWYPDLPLAADGSYASNYGDCK